MELEHEISTEELYAEKQNRLNYLTRLQESIIVDPYEHEDFTDAVGELVNMISGGAKALLEGKEVSMGCPSVVWHFTGVPVIDHPCFS